MGTVKWDVGELKITQGLCDGDQRKREASRLERKETGESVEKKARALSNSDFGLIIFSTL